MGTMTAETIHREVFVPRILVFRSDWMGGMMLPVVAATTHLNGCGLIQQQNLICSMGRMASSTIPILHRRMLMLNVFQPVDCVSMALPADLDHGFLEKTLLIRGMGRMTVQTADPVEHRPVQSALQKHFIHHVIMAAETQLVAFGLHLERRTSSGLFVTLLTVPFTKWHMHLVVEKPLLIRSVRIMTGGAACGRNLVPAMLFYKGHLAAVMTLQAKPGYILLEEDFSRRGGMRAVATDTTFFHRRMLDLDGSYPTSHFFMTVKAQGIAAFVEIEFVGCSMGIMAFHAGPFRHRLMDTCRFFRDDFGMTALTETLDLVGKKFSVRRGMRIVTPGTVPVFQGSMDEGFFHHPIKTVMTAQAVFPLCPLFQVEFVIRSMGNGQHRQTEKQSQGRQDKIRSQTHGLHPFIFSLRYGIPRSLSRQKEDEQNH